MTQNFELPVPGMAGETVFQATADSLQALQTDFAGSSAPGSPATYQLWLDTTNKVLKRWDGSAWRPVGSLYGNPGLTSRMIYNFAVTGTLDLLIPGPPQAMVVDSIRMVSSTAVAADGTDKWTFNLTNLTQAVELFSTDPSTEAVESGIGGGAVTADTTYVLTPDQNASLAAGDVLELTFTEGGTVDPLGGSFSVEIWWRPEGS